MKTVLWLCNRPIEETADRRDGTWFTAMARTLVESGEIRLVVVGQGKVKSAARYDYRDITQWVVPYELLNRKGLPTWQTIKSIQQVADEVKPDLIHVWGAENYWGLLTARGMLEGPAILEIQGIKYVCAKVFYGNLTLAERIRCIGPLEILRPGCSLFFGKRKFERWGRFEKEMVLKHKYISTQSDWVRAHMLAVKPESTMFNTGMMLRREFFQTHAWTPNALENNGGPNIFSSSSGPAAYKGLHVLVRAISILKKEYPGIILNVAGDIMAKGIRRSGYSRWLLNEAHRVGISDNIRWLGPLDANEIVQLYHQASAVVIPSFVETYSLVMAEAMVVGVPVVASYAGAMPELARDGESALFFPSGDETACAWQLRRILSEPDLAHRLSNKAREIGLSRNEPRAVTEWQIEIYNKILATERAC